MWNDVELGWYTLKQLDKVEEDEWSMSLTGASASLGMNGKVYQDVCITRYMLRYNSRSWSMTNHIVNTCAWI